VKLYYSNNPKNYIRFIQRVILYFVTFTLDSELRKYFKANGRRKDFIVLMIFYLHQLMVVDSMKLMDF